MARVSDGNLKKVRIYNISGTHDPDGIGPSPMSFEIDGVSTDLKHLSGSHHVAACLAAFAVMADADAARVTDLVVKGPPLFVNHANEVWHRLDPLLADMHPALKRLEARFDDVSYS